MSDETAQLKVQAMRSQSMFGQALTSIGEGLGGLSSFQTEAGRKELGDELKILEAEAQKAQTHTKDEEEFITNMLNVIRDVREKLAAIQAAQGDAFRATSRG